MTDERSKYDVESLRVTREEAREALDHQIDALNDIDDKAVQTLRLNVLLLGVVLTLASVLASSTVTPVIRRMANSLLVAGVVSSAASMVTAIWVHTSTPYRVGAGPADLHASLSEKPPEDELLAALLYNYATWMEQNARLNRRDGIALFASHVCLFLAMGYYASGVVFGVYVSHVEWWYSLLITAALLGFVGASVLVVRHRLGVRVLRIIRNRLG